MIDRFYAHSRPGSPESEWQSLEEHLQNVSAQAGRFASAFGAEEWGALAGLWHDVGKFSAEFQNYIRQASDPDHHVAESVGKVDHSTAGALLAVEELGVLG